MIIQGDALTELRKLPDESVHACITDPPYFLDGLGDDWDATKIASRTRGTAIIGGLPTGMKFDPAQGGRFQTFMHDISTEVYRILVPGGFYISFAQARLYHHLAMAAENAGFELRDMLAWKYEGQAKAFGQEHFVRKMKISDAEKTRIMASLGGRKTPQLKPQMEPMIFAQKPKIGTFVENWLSHEVGLIDATQTLDGRFSGNVMEVKKPTAAQKGHNNNHPTVKPVALIEHLIRLVTKPGQTIVDPFIGSGTLAVAAIEAGRRYIGFEREEQYVAIARDRIREAKSQVVTEMMSRRFRPKDYMLAVWAEAA